MPKGAKFGGRQKGTSNKLTAHAKAKTPAGGGRCIKSFPMVNNQQKVKILTVNIYAIVCNFFKCFKKASLSFSKSSHSLVITFLKKL